MPGEIGALAVDVAGIDAVGKADLGPVGAVVGSDPQPSRAVEGDIVRRREPAVLGGVRVVLRGVLGSLRVAGPDRAVPGEAVGGMVRLAVVRVRRGDRKSGVAVKSVAVRGSLVGRRICNKKKQHT